MKTPLFKGSGVAIVTPFTEDGIDFAKLGELCLWQIEQNTAAIIVCGTTGEASTMPDEEHLAAIRHVVETVDKKIPVIAGVGSNDTRHAIELSVAAQDLGADGLLSVTPYYNKATQQGLYLHFKAIAKAVKLPVIVYNVPGRTGVNINPGTLARLSAIENINGLKECNIHQVAETIHLCGDNLNIYSGEDSMVLPLLSFGGIGVISVVCNIVPDYMARMLNAWFSGDIATASRMQVDLIPLIDAMFCEVNPIPVKAALNLMGYEVGSCRMPLCDPEPHSLEKIRATLSRYKLI